MDTAILAGRQPVDRIDKSQADVGHTDGTIAPVSGADQGPGSQTLHPAGTLNSDNARPATTLFLRRFVTLIARAVANPGRLCFYLFYSLKIWILKPILGDEAISSE